VTSIQLEIVLCAKSDSAAKKERKEERKKEKKERKVNIILEQEDEKETNR
jgi:hypothetical protein